MNVQKWLLLLAVLVLLTSCGPESSSDSSFDSQPTPGPSVGDTVSDSDMDGLSDDYELELARRHSPLLIYDEEESYCVEDVASVVAHPWQVTPIFEFPGDSGRYGVLITIVILHPFDCGAFGLGVDIDTPWGPNSHNGDTEAMSMFYQQVNGGWGITKLMLHRHGDWHLYNRDAFSWVAYGGGRQIHPIVYVSESKHALFPSNCDAGLTGTAGWEDCGEGLKLRLTIISGQNVGERSHKNFDRLGDSSSSRLGMYASEYAWRQVDFCGGRGGSTCAGYIGKRWWPLEDENDRYKILQFLFPSESWHGWKTGE